MKPIITKDIFEIVTALIIQKLEEGVIPWRQPWKNLGAPRNFITRRPYRGINLLLLSALGYSSNEYLTFKQVQDVGGRVNKGEKAHLVILWLWVDEAETRKMQDVKPRKKPQLRYYFVFNKMQCTGLPEKAYAPPLERSESIPLCEAIIEEMPNCPKIVHNENEAYYHIQADFINMPRQEVFESLDSYYSVLFHELIHSTGHPDRLKRKEIMEHDKFGSETYSIEELTAEIGSCYLTSLTGIASNDLTNSVAYIQGWLDKLKADKKFIVYASAQAQRATDYILNLEYDKSDTVEPQNSVEYEN